MTAAAKTKTTPAAGAYLAELAIADIDPDPDNVRGQLGDITELTRSIKAEGVLQAVLVAETRTVRGRQRYALISGHRRWASARKAGLTTIPAQVRTGLDPIARLTAQMTENLARRDLTPIEEARGYQRLVELGASQRSIASSVGCAQGQVSKRLTLLDLPDTDQAAIAAGTLTVAAGLALAPLVNHPAAYRRCRSVTDTPDRLRSQVRIELEELAWADTRKTTRARLDAEGATVVAWPRGGWYGAELRVLLDTSDPVYDTELGHSWSDKVPTWKAATWTVDTCSHQAWTIAPNGTPIPVCTRPDAHKPPKPRSRRTAAEKAEAAAQARARELRGGAHRLAVAAAGQATTTGSFRRDLGGLVGGSLDEAQRQILDLLAITVIEAADHASVLADLVAVLEIPDSGAPTNAGDVLAWAATATAPAGRTRRLATVAVAGAAALTTWPHADAYRRGRRAAAYQLLVAHGHQPSPVELELLQLDGIDTTDLTPPST